MKKGLYNILLLLLVTISFGVGVVSAVDTQPPNITAPANLSIAAVSPSSWKMDMRFSSTVQEELNKFTNLKGVYSGHVHKITNFTMMVNGNAVLYSTMEPDYYNTTVGYTSINGSNLSYRIVDTNSSGVSSTGQLKFIVVGDPHIYATKNSERRAALTKVVNFINTKSDVDFAVFIGDMVPPDNVTPADFAAAKTILDGMTKPYYVIPGNHDVGISTVIDLADSIGNWVSSDPVSTKITKENIIKQEGFGSLKITTGSNSSGDTVIANVQPKDLSGQKYINFWVRSDVTNAINAGFGKNNITENTLTINIDQANVWKKVRWDISGIANANKNAITKFGFTVGGKSANIYVDNIITQPDTNYEDYFGSKTKSIDNVNGYQLIFPGIWRENLYTQLGLRLLSHWDFDFSNSSINKNSKTVVFIHGPVQSPFDKMNLGVPNVTDNIDPNPIVTNNFPVDVLPLGKNAVIWTATDSSGNKASATQYVTVTDSGSPTIEAPANITIASKGLKTSLDIGEPAISDAVDTNPTVTNNAPTSGFSNGSTKVTWTVTDHSGNKKTDTQYITILNVSGDTIPPMSITSLAKNTYGLYYINWTWADPKDADFDHVDIYINGAYKTNVPKGIKSYNATGLIPYTSYTIGTHTVDTSGNINQTWKNSTAMTAKDTIPPSSITNLGNTSYVSTSINWTWADPKDIDFAKVRVYINGVYKTAVSKGKQYYKPTGLISGSSYTIGTQTVDTSGNINQTWVNNTAKTAMVSGDTIPPMSITSLVKKTYGLYYINWTWADPKDADFDHVDIYINGAYKTNVPKGIKSYNATGLIPYTSYTIGTHTVDTSGNINQTWKNSTAMTAKDTIPPSSITNLGNTSYVSTSINWTWADPKDIDFAKVRVYINGVYKTAVSKGKQYYKPTGLISGSSYTIGTQTVDTSGNINQTWVNNTAKTAP